MAKTMMIDGRPVPIEGERNILEVARKAGVDLPTFCYHSELSIYGACRMCMVEDHRGRLLAACATPPAEGMEVFTNTPRLLKHRRLILELLLANHNRDCTTCEKSGSCRLQELAHRLNVGDIRFEQKQKDRKLDISASLVRDESKCILCGDCVRVCEEVQGVGALGFAQRGSDMKVMPPFGKGIGEVACVNCGQCISVCPTGAITVKSDIDRVWEALSNSKKKVVVQVAPAVRVAFGEAMGKAPGTVSTGQVVAALRRIGFDKVYDTNFTADLTVLEELAEFLVRIKQGGSLPLFTSCCPAWVKFAEQFYPERLESISTCRSPQAMFGAIAKAFLPEQLGVSREDLFVVSIMPCTAKKFEAARQELATDGNPDVDAVLTTQELVRMAGEANIDLSKLPSQAFDLPFGMSSGAGVIFGTTGGVAEAVLRTAAKGFGERAKISFEEIRGFDGCKEAAVTLGDLEIKVAVIHGLNQAHKLMKAIEEGRAHYHLVEVMACPGGCVGGGGQPTPNDMERRKVRAQGLYDIDEQKGLKFSDDNPWVKELYRDHLGEIGSSKAHKLLHTYYSPRRRISGEEVSLICADEAKTQIRVCVGTNCFLKGSYDVLAALREAIEEEGLEGQIDLGATFCLEECNEGPGVRVNGKEYKGMTPEKARELINSLIGK